MPHDHHAGTPCWVGLATDEPATAAAFYAAVLGWQIEDLGPDMGGYHLCRVDGALIAGIGHKAETLPDRPLWMVDLQTPDLDGCLAAWLERGARILTPPHDTPGMGRFAFLADPYGAPFGLWEPGPFPGFEAVGPPGTPCWFEVNTPQAELLRDHFAELFGLSWEPMAGMAYWTLHAGDRPRFGVLQMTDEWEGIDPHWMPYFAVADADAALERVREAGGTVCFDPFDTPFGRIAVCNDPQGAVFTLIKPAAGG